MAYWQIRWENTITRRYYQCILEYDLFNELLLTIVYGGINSANGKIKKTYATSLQEATQRIDTLAKARYQRGYQIVFQINTF